MVPLILAGTKGHDAKAACPLFRLSELHLEIEFAPLGKRMLTLLLVISGLMMAINNLVAVRYIVTGGVVPLANVVCFFVCLCVWCFISYLSSERWWIAFAKHLLYSMSLFGMFIALFGLYLTIVEVSGRVVVDVPFIVIFCLIFVGALTYEGCRRLLNVKLFSSSAEAEGGRQENL